jgi:hypothetical protein
MRDEAVGIELDRLLAPLSRLVKILLAEGDVSHGLSRAHVGGIVAQHVFEQRAGVTRPPHVGQEFGSPSIGLRLRKWLHDERGIIDIDRARHFADCILPAGRVPSEIQF